MKKLKGKKDMIKSYLQLFYNIDLQINQYKCFILS